MGWNLQFSLKKYTQHMARTYEALIPRHMRALLHVAVDDLLLSHPFQCRVFAKGKCPRSVKKKISVKEEEDAVLAG
jgi:hypothetical protein